MERLNEFIKKYRIEISPLSMRLCREGIERMKKSIDPAHDEKHVENILENIDGFLESKEVKVERINFEILLVAICWHDVWKSTRMPDSIVSVLVNQIWDGWGSAKVYKREVKLGKEENKRLRKVFWIIGNHPRDMTVHMPFRTYLETKILKDADRLERWNLKRHVDFFEKLALVRDVESQKWVRWLIKFFKKKYTLWSDSDKKYYFRWAKDEFRKRREMYIVELERQG
ncbi:MAG: hypothetical protein WC841_03515 [Candidatus Shapirobacteria bacterium]|jgi:hypothetical protein